MTQLSMDPKDRAKKAAALKALEFVTDGMNIGLGTGTTAYFMIEGLAEMQKGGMHFQLMASSKRSAELAAEFGLKVSEQLDTLDLTIDGADEVDPDFNLIKGGGGALTREKILAANARKLIIVVDHTKQVQALGKFPLPIEILPFGHQFTLKKIEAVGCRVRLRQNGKAPYLTDNGNWIADTEWGSIQNPSALNVAVRRIPGVVEVGLFESHLVHKLIVGFPDGTTRVLPSPD